MKKILALMITIIMCMSVGLYVFASEVEATTYTITIDNAVKGETYSAYKVFDVTYSGTNSEYSAPGAATSIPGEPDTTNQHTAYSYTITKSTDDSSFWTDLTTNDSTNNPVDLTDGVYSLTKFGIKFVPTTTANLYNVMPIDETNGVTAAQAEALAVFLATKLTGKTAVKSGKLDKDANATDPQLGTLTLDVTSGGAGYYFVDTTTGSLCSLDTTEPNALIREKNDIPTEEKTVSDATDGTFGADTTVKIGDPVYFKIEITDAKGTDKKVTVHDTMDSALTLHSDSFAIATRDKTGTATTTVASSNYTVTVAPSDGCTFEIVFTDAFIQGLDETKVIVITYDAELNGNAVTVSPWQVNKTHLTYSNQSTVEKTVTVKTYEGDVVKTDDQNKILDGATFNLYDAKTGGNKYNLVMVSDGKYRLKVSTDETASYAEKLVPKDGKLTIVGLENGTYYLEEVDHPDGYTPLTERKALTINNANDSATINGTTYVSGGVQVINKAGTELPSTGGIGTMIFYMIGAALVIGAIVLFASRKRFSAK